MTEHKLLDAAADVLPVGLHPTPFGEVWQALQQVAASVWDVDPSVYRAGIAWMWYALRNPAALDADGLRPLLVAALISEQAPLVKDTQTAAELAEYLRLWRDYTPTYPKLEALYGVFAADVEILPITAPGYAPPSNTRLAFFVVIRGIDFDRPLTADEAAIIAVRATPLGSHPVVVTELSEDFSLPVYPLRAGVPAISVENDAICTLPPMTFIVVDSITGKLISGFKQELTTYELPSVILESEDDYETYELPSVSLPTPNVVIGVPISVPVQAFWFTNNGQAETVDTELVVRNGLHDADGVNVKSVDSTDYQDANVLAYMEADGDMFTSSDASFTWFGNDSLRQLFVSNQDARGKSAWSVFAAKLFHLSFVNTQLPDVTIELPAAVVDTYGTQITLPTMTGEYESGGKTWKPSAWDIGAFGSSYTLNADTVAHLVFEEVQQYQEITLYMAGGQKNFQGGIMSSFKGNVESSYVYPLYTDSGLTTRFVYDYSNDYEIGYYVSGVWTPRVQNVSDLPSSSTEFKLGYILLDVGSLWFVCSGSSVGMNFSSIIVRIYPKDQQYYAAYAYGSNTYGNAYIGISTSKLCVKSPGSTQYIQTPHQFPHITLQKVLGAAGNEITATTFVTGQGADDTRFYVYNSGVHEAYIRTVIFTLEYPIIGHWLKSDGTNVSTSSGVAYPLMNIGGEIVEIDNAFDYFPIALIRHNGNYATSTYSYLNNATMGAFDPDHPTRLCFKQVSGTLSLSYVQYYKKPKSIEVNFGDPVTIPAGYHVESVKCQRLYVKADSVEYTEGATSFIFAFNGANLYCNDTSKSSIGKEVLPCLSLDVYIQPGSVHMLSFPSGKGWSQAGLTNSSANELNSNGYFVRGSVQATTASWAQTFSSEMQTYPTAFLKYDSSGNAVPYYFKIQQSLWQFQNGTFSWIGDTTDTSDLAYWYNGRAVQIILAMDE